LGTCRSMISGIGITVGILMAQLHLDETYFDF